MFTVMPAYGKIGNVDMEYSARAKIATLKV